MVVLIVIAVIGGLTGLIKFRFNINSPVSVEDTQPTYDQLIGHSVRLMEHGLPESMIEEIRSRGGGRILFTPDATSINDVEAVVIFVSRWEDMVNFRLSQELNLAPFVEYELPEYTDKYPDQGVLFLRYNIPDNGKPIFIMLANDSIIGEEITRCLPFIVVRSALSTSNYIGEANNTNVINREICDGV